MRIVVPPEFPASVDDEPVPEPEPTLGTGSRVWLVRHAEVHADWQKRAYGNLDVPLSERGEQDTRSMCAAFTGARLARVLSSNLSRALGLRPHESFAFQNDPAHATLLVDAAHGWVLAASNANGPRAAQSGSQRGTNPASIPTDAHRSHERRARDR